MYVCIYKHTYEHVFYIALKDAKCGDYNWLTEFCSSLKTDRTIAKIGPVHSAASDTFESNGFTSWHKTEHVLPLNTKYRNSVIHTKSS